jgi:hypothetical protein
VPIERAGSAVDITPEKSRLGNGKFDRSLKGEIGCLVDARASFCSSAPLVRYKTAHGVTDGCPEKESKNQFGHLGPATVIFDSLPAYYLNRVFRPNLPGSVVLRMDARWGAVSEAM